jgi:hypothetical protein
MKKIPFGIIAILIVLSLKPSFGRPREGSGSITPWEIGINGGVSTFIISINPEVPRKGNRINFWNRDINPGAGLSLTKNFSPFWGLELNWLYTKLSGTWNNKYPLPYFAMGNTTLLTFDTRINQIDLMVPLNINQMIIPDVDQDRWHFYVKPGIGITQITDTKKFYSDGSSYIRPSINFEAGVSIALNANFKLMFGSTIRFVDTDNLDGLHVDAVKINGSTAKYLKVYEIYNFSYIRLSYCFGQKNDRTRFGLGF